MEDKKKLMTEEIKYVPEKVMTPREYWKRVCADRKPCMSYKSMGLPFDEWKMQARVKLLELLGEIPERVPLNAQIEFTVDQGDYYRRRVIIDVDKYMKMPMTILIPKGEGRHPAILCTHGHGPYGKDAVTGERSTPALIVAIEEANYNYAEQMTKAGFVTVSPDLRGFGERHDAPDTIDIPRDPCDVNYVKGSIFGIYPLTLNIFDMMCAIDYMETMDEVDKSRIGMMGLSYGGTMTIFTTAVDDRIKACDIISALNPYGRYGIRDGNFCGSQVVPGLYRYLDTVDIAGLIAPRPCLVEMGIYDSCHNFEDLWNGYIETKAIYDGAGATDKIDFDAHPNGHAFGQNKAFEFFKKNL